MKCPCCGEEMVIKEDKGWTEQLNCYRWLAHQYGVPIANIQIVALLRDWSKPEAGRDPSYPQAGVVVFDIPLWDEQTTLDWICLRIGKHEAAKSQLPDCTADEVWERPAKWAVQKRGAKRATKLHDTEKSARLHAQSSPDLEVQFRPGQRPRCENYCVVANFCSSWQAYKDANAKANNQGLPNLRQGDDSTQALL